ncbi:asparagine synthase family protein [Lewinella cohaerens]|uniref:asparagine synthase-related protein n=1 Tax=Lewinella cohaerens TaxID=70995 RepID=UPI00036F90E8|nr:asparagine synthetase B family protein [Lewinella cohaerens]
MHDFFVSFTTSKKVTTKLAELKIIGKYWFIEDGHTPSEAAILSQYRNLGFQGLLEKLSGSFVISIHDPAAERLYLATDAFGTLPLFFYFRNSARNFLTSTAIRKIVAGLKETPKFNQTFLFSRSSDQSSFEPTLYENLFRLGAGEILILDTEQWEVTSTRYWDLSKAKEYPLNIIGSQPSESDYVSAYHHLLTEATHHRLQGIDQALLTLSGGFDSSILLLLSQQKTRLHALSICTETSILNKELERAVELSQLYGIAHDILPCSLFDRPSLASWQDAVIDAQDPRLNYELYLKSQLLNIPLPYGKPPSICISGLGSDQYNGGTTAFDYSTEGLHQNWDSFWEALTSNTYKKKALNDGNNFFRFAGAFLKNAAWSSLTPVSSNWVHYVATNHRFLTHKTIPLESSISLQNGLMTIYPFLDLKLVAFLQQVPSEMFDKLFFQKSILRKAFLSQLPDSFKAKNKFHPIPQAHKFIFRYLQQVLHGENRLLFNRAFTRSSAINELFDRDAIEKFLVHTQNSGFYPAYEHLLYIINLGILDAYYNGVLEKGERNESMAGIFSGSHLVQFPDLLANRMDTTRLSISLQQAIHLVGELDIAKNDEKEIYYVILDEKLMFDTEEIGVVQFLRLIDGQRTGAELQELINVSLEEVQLLLEFLWEENIIYYK